MGMHGYALFDTPLGRCAIAWSERGIAAVELPGSDDAATRRRIARTLPHAAEATLALDMDGVPEFHRKVYDAARAIPPGETRSYGEVAAALGEPGAAQAVGRALGRNPFPIVVPCHRVLAANGALHGFSAPGGIETKRRMLALEGAGAPTLFD
jgi:methylated-DNA-[protein]-cysteine S-methyltransferase